MAKYIAKPDEWISPSETTGSIQNVGGTILEVSSTNTDNTGIRLNHGQILSFDGVVYVRSIGNINCEFTTVPFKVTGKGGGGSSSPYTLPTASEDIKGGIKIGEDFFVTDEVLNIKDFVIPSAKVTKIDDGVKLEVKDKTESSEAVVYNGKDGETPTITFTDNQDGTYTLRSILGNSVQEVIVHDGSDGAEGEDGKSAYEIAVELGYSGTEMEWITSLKGEKGEKGDNGKSVEVNIDESKENEHKVTFTVGDSFKSTTIYDGKDGKDGDTEEWVSGKSYFVGKLVIYNDNIYKCSIANEDEVFNSEKWKLIGSYPVYSSSETIIGTWTDDKTIYQKTYKSITPSKQNTFIKLFNLDSNIDTIITIESTCINIITGSSDINSIVDIDNVKVVAFDGAIYVKIYGSQQAERDIFITIKYTKNS